MRRTRERALGDEHLIDHLSTARGRPADLAARQLVAFRGEEHGVAGELGLTALQAWQRLADAAKPDEILVSDRALETLNAAVVESSKRRFRAKGAPKDLTAYAVTPRTGSS